MSFADKIRNIATANAAATAASHAEPTSELDRLANAAFAKYKAQIESEVQAAAEGGGWQAVVTLNKADIETSDEWTFQDVFYGNPKKVDFVRASFVPVFSRLVMAFSEFSFRVGNELEDSELPGTRYDETAPHEILTIRWSNMSRTGGQSWTSQFDLRGDLSSDYFGAF